MTVGAGLPVECDACGRIGLYPTEAAATQMVDVHLIAAHGPLDEGDSYPGMSILPWLKQPDGSGT